MRRVQNFRRRAFGSRYPGFRETAKPIRRCGSGGVGFNQSIQATPICNDTCHPQISGRMLERYTINSRVALNSRAARELSDFAPSHGHGLGH